MHRRALLGLAASSLLDDGEALAAPAELCVIAHPSTPIGGVDAAALRLVFQVIQLRWSNDTVIVPFNLPEEHPLRQAFDRAVLGLSPEKVARYWIDKRIRGDVRPPRKAASPALVLRAVAKLSGAIGYVSATEDVSSVKVLARIRDGKVFSS